MVKIAKCVEVTVTPNAIIAIDGNIELQGYVEVG
jgi:hypothetical protein